MDENPNNFVFDYSEDGWEVDEVLSTYDVGDDEGYDFDKKLIGIDAINSETGEFEHIDLIMSPDDYRYFVTSLIDDDNLKDMIDHYLKRRQEEEPEELRVEMLAESKNK